MKIQIPVCVVLASWSMACGNNGATPTPPPGVDAAIDAAIDAGLDAVVDDFTQVRIADGAVHGSLVGTSRQFLGIPYAKPPVGALRWQPPQKPAPWTTPLEATQFSKRCAQLASATLQTEASNDEDCLYLNVWTPAGAPSAALPVMVWFHGGSNTGGSTSDVVPFVNRGIFYSGEVLAENHGVIVVTLNYRLGIFGFFDHGDLVAEGGTGNQGLLDQQLALRWVHDNIAKFGGDPGNVTIFGESAGAFDVCMHVAAPSSLGLFQRAIGESGGCTTEQRPGDQGKAAATAFATSVGCPPEAPGGPLACLRAKSAAELMASPAVAAGTGFGLDVDGVFMPAQPHDQFVTGRTAPVPYLLGSNTDEGTLFLPPTKVTTEAGYLAAIDGLANATSAEIAAVYPISHFADGLPNPAEAALARVIGDVALVCSTLDTAILFAHAGGAVHVYNFDVPVPIVIPGSYLGASHGSEIPSVFGTSPIFSPETKAVSDLMQRYWTQFARTGDPNGADLAWPAFTDAANVRINFALQPTIVTGFRATECAFWRSHYAEAFPAFR
jgi:para-nitrobenzyl esterase